MDFHLSRLSYLADFVLVPFFMMVSLWYAITLNDSLLFVPATALGFMLWNPFEYCVHRYLLHDWYRKAHWLHHMQPRKNIGAPGWLTCAFQFFLFLALASSFGAYGAFGCGLYFGFAAGYLAYIVAHFWIHRFHVPRGHFLYPAFRRHALHHGGIDKNFNVLFPLCDWLFGTFEQPGG